VISYLAPSNTEEGGGCHEGSFLSSNRLRFDWIADPSVSRTGKTPHQNPVVKADA